jgi:hypothetical protein
MLTIDVFSPASVRLTLNSQAEIWLDPAEGQGANALPKLVLCSRGQAMEGITAFADTAKNYQVLCNSVIANAYPHLPCEMMGLGSTREIELADIAVSITMVHAACDSVLPGGQAGGLACGFIIRAAGHKVYLAGHTGVTGELRFIGDFYKPTIAILPLNNSQGIALDTLPRVLGWVGADMVVPWPLASDISDIELRDTVDAYASGFCKLLKPGTGWTLPEALSSGRSSGPESRY